MTECPECPYRLWPVRCHAAAVGSRRLCELARTRPDYRAAVAAKTMGAAAAPPATAGSKALTVERAMRIRTCPVRVSPCECVGKPAICRRDDPAGVEVLCLTAGPDGGPCPGADRLSSATASR